MFVTTVEVPIERLWQAAFDVSAWPAWDPQFAAVWPLEVAQAYTLFLNGGSVRPLRSVARINADTQSVTPPEGKMAPVASPQSAFLVTNMMRSVLNEGTGAGARGMGFTRDAAGKTATSSTPACCARPSPWIFGTSAV